MKVVSSLGNQRDQAFSQNFIKSQILFWCLSWSLESGQTLRHGDHRHQQLSSLGQEHPPHPWQARTQVSLGPEMLASESDIVEPVRPGKQSDRYPYLYYFISRLSIFNLSSLPLPYCLLDGLLLLSSHQTTTQRHFIFQQLHRSLRLSQQPVILYSFLLKHYTMSSQFLLILSNQSAALHVTWLYWPIRAQHSISLHSRTWTRSCSIW